MFKVQALLSNNLNRSLSLKDKNFHLYYYVIIVQMYNIYLHAVKVFVRYRISRNIAKREMKKGSLL